MFEYRPQFKIWLVSNWPLQADADDDASWGRVQVFTFPHSHLGAEDVGLKERMKSAENLRGVLRWAVEGAARWYTQGRLVPPTAIVAATNAHRDAQDHLAQWIDDRCMLGTDRWSTSAALMASYQAWCKASNIPARNQTDFSETLIRRFGCVSKRGHGGTRGYGGIALQPLADD
jgi:phage/plasmid-associated DNA primase